MTEPEPGRIEIDPAIVPTEPASVYTAEHASGSLVRAAKLVLVLTAVGVPVALYLRGWQSALLLFVGALVSASGLWEWKRLMTALMARMEEQDAVMAAVQVHAKAGDRPTATHPDDVPRPSIAFAIAGFLLRIILVMVVLYVSLKYLHGSVLALAAGLAMGVIALTVEGLRLLRSGTI